MTNRAKERKRKEKNYECKHCFTPIEKKKRSMVFIFVMLEMERS